jgi:hypothetical protein
VEIKIPSNYNWNGVSWRMGKLNTGQEFQRYFKGKGHTVTSQCRQRGEVEI